MNPDPRARLGLALYSVNNEMESDPRGTLSRIATFGYTEVELSPMSKLGANELRPMLDDAGLTNPSGHYMLPDLLKDLDAKIDFARAMGQRYMVLSVPWIADMARVKADPKDGQMGFFLAMVAALTPDDYKWNADRFNKIGEKIKSAGLLLAYHNHNFEFAEFTDGVTGYDELLRLTDPNLVTFEMDCGWVTVAGRDPVEFLQKHPGRYALLHLKDFKEGFTPTHKLGGQGIGAPVSTELGRGSIDYRRILSAASRAGVDSMFVEQEPPFTEMSALDAAKMNCAYLRSLTDPRK